jgi:hypothetical protein
MGCITERVINSITAPETIRKIRSLLTTAHTNPAFVSPGSASKIFTRTTETITEIQNPMTTLQKRPLVIAIPKPPHRPKAGIKIPSVPHGANPLVTLGERSQFLPQIADMHINRPIKDAEITA